MRRTGLAEGLEGHGTGEGGPPGGCGITTPSTKEDMGIRQALPTYAKSEDPQAGCHGAVFGNIMYLGHRACFHACMSHSVLMMAPWAGNRDLPLAWDVVQVTQSWVGGLQGCEDPGPGLFNAFRVKWNPVLAVGPTRSLAHGPWPTLWWCCVFEPSTLYPHRTASMCLFPTATSDLRCSPLGRAAHALALPMRSLTK